MLFYCTGIKKLLLSNSCSEEYKFQCYFLTYKWNALGATQQTLVFKVKGTFADDSTGDG